MEPSMTHPATCCINLLLNLQNKLDIKERGQRRWSHQFMFTHKLVPHLPSQHAVARMAKNLSFHTCYFLLIYTDIAFLHLSPGCVKSHRFIHFVSRIKLVVSEDDVRKSYQRAMDSMARLNRTAARLMHKYNAHGSTDITGKHVSGLEVGQPFRHLR
jgi:hypothetical protein